MAEKSVQVVVLGSGPGGYVAAIRAAQLGRKVLVVERERSAASASRRLHPQQGADHAGSLKGEDRHASAFGSR